MRVPAHTANGRRRAFRFSLFLLAGLFLVSGTASAESIRDFSVTADVRADASILVEERIRYDFGELDKHGIYRDIPVKYETPYGNRQSLIIDVESVTDGTGRPYEYALADEGDDLRIKIGDPDRTITGEHTYAIRYTARLALGYFDGYDELYWNVTGNAWPVPIERSAVIVTLPEGTSVLQASCYLGPFGSTESCDRWAEVQEATYTVRSGRLLDAGEGLTVAVGFTPGVVTRPSFWERARWFLADNPLVLFPFLVFAVMHRIWWKRGRDPKGRGTIVAEYSSPENLSALHIGALMKESVGAGHISAALIELAVGGYLTIKKETRKILLFDREDYVFTRTDKPSDGAWQDKLLSAVFGSKDGFGKAVALSEMKNKFYKHIPDISKAVIQDLLKAKLYAEDPGKVKGRFVLYGIGAVFASFFLLPLHGVAAILSIIAGFVVYFAFAALMSRVTREGAVMRERILGLKEYLQIAEKDRINFHNAPEKRPELFEALLPFAMVLGVEKAWAKEFEDVYTTPPQWYSDATGRGFSVGAFSSDLSHFSAAAASTMASAPGSSSGSGGGGSSGGGGGGGGGGSW